MRFRKVLTLLTAAAFSIVALSAAAASFKTPEIVKGVLDLRGWNPRVDGPVDLAGEWEFYWKKLLSEKDFLENPPVPDAYPVLPSFWNNLTFDNEKAGCYGYGTYRLKILLDNTSEVLAIKNLSVFTAFELFVNGKRIASDGKVGTNSDNTSPHFRPQVNTFLSDTGEVRLLLHISNYHQRFGGAGRKLVFGSASDLMWMREKSLAIEMIVFGCLLIVGIYYLVLFSHRRKEIYTLYFALFCLAMALRTILTGEKFLVQLFPGIPFWLIVLLMDLTFYLGVPAFILYTAYLFPRNINRRIVSVFVYIMLGGALLVAATPAWINGFVGPYFQAVSGIALLYLFVAGARAISGRRYGAGLFTVGFIMMLITVLNDILFNNDIVNTAYLSSYGLVVFILVQTFVLSGKFSRAFHNVEQLTDKLEHVNKDLFKIVEERTEELNAAMEELRSSNENLLSVNRDLETAHRTAARDMDMAANVQQSYLPDTAPYAEKWDIACYFRPTAAVSGDFYDFYVEDDQLRGVGLFDVSGHGIASGLITMLAKATFFRIFMGGLKRSLSEVISYANSILQDELEKVDNYLTGVLLRFTGNTVEYVNAAHSDILLKNREGVKPVLNEEGESNSGVFLGISLFTLPYDNIQFEINSNDVILLFSDCLVENKNIQREVFGKERVIKSFGNAPDGSAQDILEHIMNDFINFVGSENNLTDDLTVLILRRK